MSRNTEDTLISLGIMPNLKGFFYICRAIEVINAVPGIKIGEVYNTVAEQFGVEWGKVERAIRYSRLKIDLYACSSFLAYVNNNSEFLYTLALLVKRKGEENE